MLKHIRNKKSTSQLVQEKLDTVKIQTVRFCSFSTTLDLCDFSSTCSKCVGTASDFSFLPVVFSPVIQNYSTFYIF